MFELIVSDLLLPIGTIRSWLLPLVRLPPLMVCAAPATLVTRIPPELIVSVVPAAMATVSPVAALLNRSEPMLWLPAVVPVKAALLVMLSLPLDQVLTALLVTYPLNVPTLPVPSTKAQSFRLLISAHPPRIPAGPLADVGAVIFAVPVPVVRAMASVEPAAVRVKPPSAKVPLCVAEVSRIKFDVPAET